MPLGDPFQTAARSVSLSLSLSCSTAWPQLPSKGGIKLLRAVALCAPARARLYDVPRLRPFGFLLVGHGGTEGSARWRKEKSLLFCILISFALHPTCCFQSASVHSVWSFFKNFQPQGLEEQSSASSGLWLFR